MGKMPTHKMPTHKPPWHKSRKKILQPSYKKYNNVPWNFCRYYEFDRSRNNIQLLEKNCIYQLVLNRTQWNKGQYSIKNMLKDLSWFHTVKELQSIVPNRAKLWYITFQYSIHSKDPICIYIFKQKSHIKQLVRIADVITIMES